MTNDLHAHLTAAAAEAARVARAVRPERLDDPTPCGEYDVRALADHLVLWTSYGLEARARGESVPDDWQKRDFTSEPGWPQTYRDRLDAALAAWSDPAVWERELDMGGTPVPAAAVAGMMLLELALHGWDLARAIGEPFALPQATAEAVLALVEEHAGMYRQYQGFADPVPAPDGAPALARAVALSGRDPRWGA